MVTGSVFSKEFKNVDEALEQAFTGLGPKNTVEEATEMMATGRREILVPSEIVSLERLWNSVHRVIGPDTSLLMDLMSAFPSLSEIMLDLETSYARAAGSTSSLVRTLAYHEINELMERLPSARKEILVALEEQAAALRPSLQGELRQEMETLAEGYRKSLDEFDVFITQRRDAMKSLTGAGLSSSMRAQRRRMVVTEIMTKGADDAVAGVGWAFKKLAESGADIPKLSEDLFKRMNQARRGTLVDGVWHLVDPDSLIFARVLGVFTNQKMKGDSWPALVKAWKSKGLTTLKAEERAMIEGHLNQLRGLLPEEATDKIGVLEAVGKKRAHEVVANLPDELKAKAATLSVKHQKGPFWIKGDGNAWKEFGDGATFLEEASGQEGYLMVLGESKSYLPEDIFKQLFEISDPRYAGIEMHFVDELGKLRSIKMKPLPGNIPPTYVFSLPSGMTAQEDFVLRGMVERRVSTEREVLKLDLPFTREHNEAFVWMLFEQAMAVLEKAK